MRRKIEEAERSAPPPKSNVKSDLEPNFCEPLLTVEEAAKLLRLSPSWLAKARMRGDGPAYVKLGRAIRYGEGALRRYMKSCSRLSTSER